MSSIVIAGDTSGTCTLQAANVAGNTVLNLPTTSGTLVSSGAIPAAGSTTQVQYNNAGSFAGSSNFVFDGTNVGIGTSSPSVPLAVYKASDSAINIQNSTSGVTNVDGLQLLLSGANGYMWNYENGANIFGTNNTERMRIDSSGNVGIGTSSPTGKFNVGGGRSNFGANSETYSIGLGFTQTRVNSGQTYYIGATDSATPDLVFSNSAGTERGRFTNGGDLQFNSGYGSVATAYGCRAWVNFDGTGTPAIRASGNVSSITDNGTGDYTVNFTNAMPDINYSATGFAWASNKNACAIFLGPKVTTSNPETTSSIRVATRDNISETVMYDPEVVNVAVFR